MLLPPPSSPLFPYTTLFRSKNLPEVCREQFSRRTSFALWIQAELIAMATDLAEFLGAALGFQDRKSTRLNSSHRCISYAVFCLKKKKQSDNLTVAQSCPIAC